MSINFTARQVATAVGVTAATLSGAAAYRDATDRKPDSANGYIGYGIAASIGVSLLSGAVSGNVSRGLASASVLGAVLGGGILGLAVGSALQAD